MASVPDEEPNHQAKEPVGQPADIRPETLPPLTAARPPQAAQQGRRKPRLKGIAPAALVLLLAVGVAVAGLYEYRAPDFLRTTGVVHRSAAALKGLGAQSFAVPPAALFLKFLVAGNQESQEAAVGGGALEAAVEVLQEGKLINQRAALSLLEGLVKDNSAAKDAFLKQGGVEAVSEAFKQDSSEGLSSDAARLLAVFAADNEGTRKKGAAKSGAVQTLLEYLEGGNAPTSRSYVNAAWALANLAAGSSYVQSTLLEAGGSELVARLLQNREGHPVLQPAIYTAGNLAAQNQAAQEALRETGALVALTKLIEAAVAGRRLKASEPFHTEILEHVAELQRTDPAVRAALAEVGGLEELLGIIEAGATIKTLDADRDKQLIAVEESEDEEEDRLHGIRRLVRELQDEVDSSEGILPEVKVPSLTRGPSGSRTLKKPYRASRQGIASDAAWALGLLVGGNQASQDAAREAGAVEALVKLLESAEDAAVAKGALGAISSLAKGNSANKVAVREAHGVEGLVKLLASNPADKEVLKATARALKFMSADRPAYETLQRSSARWLRVLGRQAAALVSDTSGFQISPAAISAAVAFSTLLAVLAFLLITVSRLFSRKNQPGKAAAAQPGSSTQS